MQRLTGPALLCAALMGLFAAPAHAAFEVTSFAVTPASTAAGAHADVTIAAGFPAYSAGNAPQRARNLVFHLPPGLAGDPFATPRCAEAAFRADSCPAATRIGSVAATADAVVLGLPVAQDVTGDLYNVVPSGAEPARLGAVLRPLGGLLGKFTVATTVSARASDGGLDATVRDLPTELNGLQVYTSKLSFTLQGRPGGKPFMRNPTSCRPAISTVDATPYGEPAAPVSRTSSFTPTSCGALPFAPHITGTIGAKGQTAARSHPPVTTVITQGAEQAGQAAVTVTLPPVVGPDLAQLARACPAERVAAATCPATARVGRVVATTPLLAQPLTGDVFLAGGARGALPGLAIQLGPPIPLRLTGSVALTPQGIRTTFTGLPDVPLARFALSLDGGPTGLFSAGRDLCTLRTPPAVSAVYAAQSGKQTAETRELARVGCTPRPAVSAKVWHVRSGRPVVRVSVTAAKAAPDLTELRLLLPQRLAVKPRRKAQGARVRTGAGRLPGSAFRLRGAGELRVTLPGGTRTVTAKLSNGAVRATGKLRTARKPKRLALRVLLRDGDGPRPTRTLRVRAQRR